MKTIYFEEAERITDLIGKLRIESDNELLIEFEGMGELTDIDLMLLNNASKELGKKISIHASSAEIIEAARAVGLAIVQEPPSKQFTTRELPVKLPQRQTINKRSAWKDDDLETVKLPLLKLDKKNLLYAGGVFLIISVLAFYYLIPSAVVKIFPETRLLSEAKEITVQDGLKKPVFEAQTIPGILVRGKKEKNASYSATGKARARGKVAIFNSSIKKDKSFPAGTKITDSTTSRIYTADASFKVPCGNNGPDCPSTFTSSTNPPVSVTAADGGPEYNVADGSADNFIVEGEPSYSGKSKGITEGEKKTVSQQDFDSAKNDLDNSATKEARSELAAKLPQGKLIEESIKKDVESRSVPELNKVTDGGKFEMFIGVTLSAMVFDESSVAQIIKNSAEADLKPSEVIYEFDKTKISYSSVAGGELKDGKVKIKATLDVLVGGKIDQTGIKKELAGKSEAEAEKLLDEKKGVRDFEILHSPRWFKSMPRLARHIKIEIVVESPVKKG